MTAAFVTEFYLSTHLKPKEMGEANELGLKRFEEAKRLKMRDRIGKDDLFSHQRGARCERAVRKALGVPHDPNHFNVFGRGERQAAPDVPPDIEVRHASFVNGDLMGKVKPADQETSTRLVVVYEHNSEHYILGWIPIADALRVAQRHDPGNRGVPALWVPSEHLISKQRERAEDLQYEKDEREGMKLF